MNKKAVSVWLLPAILAVIIVLILLFLAPRIPQLLGMVTPDDNPDVLGPKVREQALNKALNQMNYCYHTYKNDPSLVRVFTYCGETQKPLFPIKLDENDIRELASTNNIPLKRINMAKTNCIKVGYSHTLQGLVVTDCKKELEEDPDQFTS